MSTRVPARERRTRFGYPADGDLTRDDVKRLARDEVRAFFQGPGLHEAYEPRGIPRRAVDVVPEVTSLPGDAAPGDEVRYRTEAGFWHLVYDPSGGITHPWQVMGPELRATVDAAQDRNNGAYGDLATVGPQLTAPLSGLYRVEWGCKAKASGPAYFGVGLMVGTTEADDADSIEFVGQGATSNWTTLRHDRDLTLAAGTVVKVRYRTSTTVTFSRRRLLLHPIRVTG